MNRNPVARFLGGFLASHQGVVEPADGVLHALVGPDLAARLDCPEEVRLVFDARREGRYAGLGSDLLERALTAAGEEVPVAHALVEGIHLRGKNLDEDLRRDFSFQRCQPGSLDAVSTVIPVSRVGFRLSMVADEPRERLMTVDFLEAIRRILPVGKGLTDPLDLTPLTADDPRCGEFLPPDRLLRDLEATALERAGEEARAFQRTLQHRLRLDLNRLEEYYSGLTGALSTRGRRGALTPEERAAKRQAIEGEFRRQVDDIRSRSALRAELHPFALLRLLTPALRVRVTMRVGTHRREVPFLWTPFERRFEPFCCPRCAEFSYQIDGTRDGDLLCRTCAG